MSTESAATRAFSVSSPSDGGESMKMRSKSLRIGSSRFRKTALAISERDQFDLSARQVAVGGHEREVIDAGGDDEWREVVTLARQRVVDRAVWGRLAFLAEPTRQVRLGIEIDNENGLVREGQRGRQIDRGGGLGDAALLVGDGNNLVVFLSFNQTVHLRTSLREDSRS